MDNLKHININTATALPSTWDLCQKHEITFDILAKIEHMAKEELPENYFIFSFTKISLTEINKLLKEFHIKNNTEIYKSLDYYISQKLNNKQNIKNSNLFLSFENKYKNKNRNIIILPYYDGIVFNSLLNVFTYEFS